MAIIEISALDPGTPKGNDLVPATDTTDLTEAVTGTTKKYTRSSEFNFYMEAVGFSTLTAVRGATTASLTVVYDTGVLGVGATLTNAATQAALILDGVILAVDDRVLVKDQAAASQNGIYTVTDIGTISTNWIMTRATDYDEAVDIVQYAVVLINEGALNAGILRQETGAGPFTIGTTPIIFTVFTSQSIPAPNVSSMLYATAAAVLEWSASLTNGQFMVGNTSASPAPGTIIGGSGITAVFAANAWTLSVTGFSASWTTDASGTIAALVDNGYICGNAGATTITLPATAAIGSTVEVEGLTSTSWILTANAGQTIKIGSGTTSAAGTLTSAASTDNIQVVCIVADTTWRVQRTNSAGLTIA